ncbi:Zinc finger protein pat-9 [Aphelenchoides besseyi]|nr:Zinc finger protein pat-9 [Aphelenchoides besseyi]KAI6211089.1 Zinc finger protein pat-9 [Aphelenchoides besseyi]
MEMEIHHMPPNQPHRFHYPTAQAYAMDQQQQYAHLQQPPMSHHSLLNDLYPSGPQIKSEPSELMNSGEQSPEESVESPTKIPTPGTPPNGTAVNSLGYDLLGSNALFDPKTTAVADFNSFNTAAVALELAVAVSSAETKQSSIRTHDRKRPYPCNTCSSKFGSKMELEEHQNSHTGLKPFECEVCQSRFNRRSTLWNHKRIHSDAKPFSCTVCHMTFKWKNSLKCHKEMHQRKNESIGQVDHDIKTLTYATAAKKQNAEKNSLIQLGGAIQSAPPARKKSQKKSPKKSRDLSLSLTNQSMGSLHANLLGHMDQLQAEHQSQLNRAFLDENSQTNSLGMNAGTSNPLDFAANFNSNQLLMQAICNSNGANSATVNGQSHSNAQMRQLTADEAAAMEFVNAQLRLEQPQQSQSNGCVQSTAAAMASLCNLPSQQMTSPSGLASTQTASNQSDQFRDLCQTANAQETAQAMQNAQQIRFPPFFDPVSVFDFQQFTERNSQQLPYNITSASGCPTGLTDSIHAPIHQQAPMIAGQHRSDMLDMQNLYQHSIDPSILLNQSQQPPMDYMQNFDYMFNNANYSTFGSQGAQMVGHHSTMNNFASQPATQLHSSQLNAAGGLQLDDVGHQLSQEELQKLFTSDKWQT